MEYREFIDTVAEKVREKTGMDEKSLFFQEADETMQMDSFMVRVDEGKDEYYFLRVSVGTLYRQYQSEQDMGEIVEELAGQIESMKEIQVKEKIEMLTDYERVKKHLFIKPVNHEKHREELQDALYHCIGDIALVLCFKLHNDDKTLVNGKITEQIAAMWEMVEEELFREAMDNTMRMSPPRIFRWEKMLLDPWKYEGEDFMCEWDDIVVNTGELGNCVSTTTRTNGAIAVFGRGVARRLSDAMKGQDLYLVFTSIHEAMVHNASVVDPYNLEKILNDTIQESTPEKDVLTRHIYKYCRKEDRIMMLPVSGEQ